MTTPLADDKVQLLKWLAYDKVVPLTKLSDWHDFTRRVCFYHSTGSKDHECMLVPTLGALKYHMLRSVCSENYFCLYKVYNDRRKPIWVENR